MNANLGSRAIASMIWEEGQILFEEIRKSQDKMSWRRRRCGVNSRSYSFYEPSNWIASLGTRSISHFSYSDHADRIPGGGHYPILTLLPRVYLYCQLSAACPLSLLLQLYATKCTNWTQLITMKKLNENIIWDVFIFRLVPNNIKIEYLNT